MQAREVRCDRPSIAINRRTADFDYPIEWVAGRAAALDRRSWSGRPEPASRRAPVSRRQDDRRTAQARAHWSVISGIDEAFELDFTCSALRLPEIAGRSHPQPCLRRRSDCLRQLDRQLSRGSGPAVQRFRPSLRRDAEALGGDYHLQAQRFESLPPHDAARMGRVLNGRDLTISSMLAITGAICPRASAPYAFSCLGTIMYD